MRARAPFIIAIIILHHSNYLSILIKLRTFSVFLASNPLAKVPCAISVVKCTITFYYTIFELSFVTLSVWPLILTKTLILIVFELSCVDVTFFINFSTLSVLSILSKFSLIEMLFTLKIFQKIPSSFQLLELVYLPFVNSLLNP